MNFAQSSYNCRGRGGRGSQCQGQDVDEPLVCQRAQARRLITSEVPLVESELNNNLLPGMNECLGIRQAGI